MISSAVAGLSHTGVSPKNPASDSPLKIAWGLMVGMMVGMVAWGMVTFADLESIRTLSVLGGLPALLLELSILISLTRLIAMGTRTPTLHAMDERPE